MGWNQNHDLVKGDNLLLYLTSGKTVIAYATSCSLQIEGESIDTSSKFSCTWAAAMGGRMGYTINFDALYCNLSGDVASSGISFDGIVALQLAGEQVDWYIGQEQKQDSGVTCENNPHVLDQNKKYYYGKCVVQSISLEAGNNEIATCSGTLTGAGEILVGPASS